MVLAQYEQLNTASGYLKILLEKLRAIREFLNKYSNLLDLGNDTEMTAIIEQLGITLTISGENLEISDWSDEQLREIYDAVMAMVDQIASAYKGDKIFALMLFKDIFGNVEFRLTEGANSKDASAYASTGSDGNIINWFTKPVPLLRADIDQGRETAFYTEENIIHEFGHVLLNRYGGSSGAIFQEWQRFIKVISPFETAMGWSGANFGKLQNRATSLTLPNATLLENERVANLFEAWINGRRPELNDSDSSERRAAWAMWSFMTGECPPDDVKIDKTTDVQPCGKGLLNWLLEYGG